MTKPKATWTAISIPGNAESYVAIVQGKEIGTIARYNKKSAWTVSAGIGQHARLIGTCFHKEGAKYMLLTAPEKHWDMIREEIEGEMIDGAKDTCEDFIASNGLHYRW